MQTRLKVILAVSAALLWINGCNKTPIAYGKADKTPYETKKCWRELTRGAEIDESTLADKIVVYKEKHIMHLYRKEKIVEKFRISLGKNGTKGDKISKGTTEHLLETIQ